MEKVYDELNLKNECNIRLAIKDDIDKLIELRILQQKDDWKNEYEDLDNFKERTRKYFYEHLNKDLFIFIKCSDSDIISTCGIQIIEYLPQCNDYGIEGFICNVYTKPEYRNKGIQTNLLKECIKYSKEKRIDELQLSTDNPFAINIYKKLGFIEDDLIFKLKL